MSAVIERVCRCPKETALQISLIYYFCREEDGELDEGVATDTSLKPAVDGRLCQIGCRATVNAEFVVQELPSVYR